MPPLGTGGPGSLPPIDPPASTGGSTRAQALAGLSVRPRGPAHPAPPPEPSHAANWQMANGRCPRDRQGLGPAIRPTPCHPSQAANWQKGRGRKKRAGAGPSRKEKTSSCVSPGRAHPFAPRPRPFREWLRRELQRAGTGNTPSGPWWRPRGASPLQAPGLAGDDDGEVCFAQI